MPPNCNALLICPVCRSSLVQTAATFQCARGHSYDIAREGYLNLLLGHKKPAVQGDTREMLQARRAFLDAGHYHSLADAVASLACSHVADAGETVVLDVGSGEGRYLTAVRDYLEERSYGERVCYVGVDLSRDAARMAARLLPDAQFVVADVNELVPLPDSSVQLLLNIFAPRNVAEFARVLAADPSSGSGQGGRLLVVIPSDDHLRELRASLDLLDLEPDKLERVKGQLAAAGFELIEASTLAYPMTLPNADLQNLLRMTPNYWHMDEAAWTAVSEMGDVTATAAFTLLLFSRKL